MYCRNCGKEINNNAEVCVNCGFKPLSEKNFCQECGAETKSKQEICVKCGVRLKNQTYTSSYSNSGGIMELLKLTPPKKALPKELKKWNWGAFLGSWIWGIFHKSYNCFICLIPIVGLIYSFYCGYKGNEWAWNSKDWSNIEEFKEDQNKWTIAGIAVFLISLFVLILINQ